VGRATRAWGDDFALAAGACEDQRTHVVEAVARDAAGAELARSVALLEARGAGAIAVRPRGGSTWETLIERASPGTAAIEVEVDGFLLTDAVSGQTRSARLAVRHTFSRLGERTFLVRSFDAEGAALGERSVRFELR
jgi:hypothetical protein